MLQAVTCHTKVVVSVILANRVACQELAWGAVALGAGEAGFPNCNVWFALYTHVLGRLQMREKEADIDGIVAPIEELYGLLARYEVKVPKEEEDLVSDLRYTWKRLRKQALDVSDHLAKLQVKNT